MNEWQKACLEALKSGTQEEKIAIALEVLAMPKPTGISRACSDVYLKREK